MKYSIESHARTHTETEHMRGRAGVIFGGQQADVFISSSQSHRGRHCSALTCSERQRHLNHFNGLSVWSLRHTRKDYCDCICPTPMICLCRGIAGSRKPVIEEATVDFNRPTKQNCSLQRGKSFSGIRKVISDFLPPLIIQGQKQFRLEGSR